MAQDAVSRVGGDPFYPVSGFLSPLSTSSPMCPQTPFIKATFKRPWDTTAILFLVEDSDLMIGLQHSLRESHLRMVLDAVMEGKPPGSVGSPASVLDNSDHILPRLQRGGCPPLTSVLSKSPPAHEPVTNSFKNACVFLVTTVKTIAWHHQAASYAPQRYATHTPSIAVALMAVRRCC